MSSSMIERKWLRLGSAVILAVGLVLILLFTPLFFNTTAQNPASPSKILGVSLPFQAEAVYATGGLTITKIASPSPVNHGELLTYTLLIENNTPDDLTNISVTDTVPANTTCVEINTPPHWFSQGVLNCQSTGKAAWFLPSPSSGGGVITSGTSVLLAYTVRVDQPLPDLSEITNDAFSYGVKADSPTTYTDSGADTVTATVYAPEWNISKSALTTIQPGERLTYTITAENVGHLATQGAYTITDVIPDNTTFITTTPTAQQNGNTLTWGFTDTLDVNDTRVVTYVVQVTSPLTDGETIVNSTYSVTGGNVFTGAAGTPFITLVSSTADLTVTKTATPDPIVEAGALLTYTLTVTNQNTAQGPALNVVISDTLPANTVFQNAGFIAPATGVVTPNGNTIRWALDDPISVNGQAQVQVVARVQSPLVSGTLLINSPAVSATNSPAVINGNPVTTVISSSSRIEGISKVVQPATVAPGETVTYTITITNTGNQTATGVQVTDTLDSNFPTSSFNFSKVTVPGRDINGTAGITTVVFSTAAPSLPGVYSNTLVTVTNGTEIDILGETAPVQVTSPAFTLSKVAARSVITAGENLSYTLTYTNSGVSAGTNVLISDTLPAGVTLIDSNPITDFQTGNEVGWLVGTVGSNVTGTIVLTVSVPASFDDNTVINNSATLTSTELVGDSAGPIPVTVRAPVLNLSKSAGANPVDAGGILTYTLTYSNSGGASASVRITDTFDANTSFASANPAPTGGTGQIRFWDIANLPPTGIDQTIIVTVNVTSPLTNNLTLTNTATIANVGHSAQATATTTVSSAEILNISKSSSRAGASVKPGEFITYTITYSNSGNAIAHGVRITDTIDGNTTFQGATSGVINNDPEYIWNIGDLAPSASTQITLTVQANDPLPSGTVLTNSVIIRSNAGVTDTAQVTDTLQNDPILHLNKQAITNTVEAGGTLTYTIYYSNTGNAPATGVIITDTLPAELHLQSANPSPDSGSDPTYRWNIGTVAVGGPFSITLVVTADQIIPDLTPLTNVVTMTNVETDTLTANEVVTAHAVDLNISKTASSVVVKANEFITYTITVQNQGHATANNLIITDTLPISIVQSSVVSAASAGVTFNNFSAPDVYTWNAPTLAGQSSLTLTISGQLVTDPWSAAGLVFTNMAEVSSADSEATLGNNFVNRPATGRPGDPFTITLVAVPTTITVGNSIPVTATVTDQWGNPAFNGTVVSFQSSFGTLLPTGDPTQNGVAATTISSNIPGTAVITGTASAGSISDTTTVTFTTGAPDHFVIDPIANQTAGVPFSITITVVDNLNNPITTYNSAVTLTDSTGTLSPTTTGTSWVNGVWSSTAVITQAWTGDLITATQSTLNGTSNLFDVLPGPAATAVLTTTSPVSVCGTSLVSAAVMDAYNNPIQTSIPISFYHTSLGPAVTRLPNPRLTDNSGLVTTAVTSVGAGTGLVSVYIDVDGDFTALPSPTNWEAANSINFTNPPAPTGLTLNVAPNPLLTGGNNAVVTATVTTCTGAVAGQTVVFNISDPSLASLSTTPFTATTNASGVATATITSNSTPVAGTLTITATAGTLEQTTNLTIQLATAPVLTISKAASPASGSDVRPGQTINYTIRVTNTGTAVANNVIISDTLSGSVGFVSGSSSGVFAYNTGTSTFTAAKPTLGINEALTATIQVTVTAQVSGTLIDNSATVDSNETLPVTSTVVSHAVITGSRTVYLPLVLRDFVVLPDLTITNFEISPANPSSSDPVVITVTVQNIGTAPTSEGFWVDFYIDPVPVPDHTMGERRWEKLGSNVSPKKGLAWKVTSYLAPGQSIILTSTGAPGTLGPDPSFAAEWLANSTFVPGSDQLYSYADSFDSALIPEGEIVEILETNNRAYIDLPGTGVSGLSSSTNVDGQSVPPQAERPDLGN